MILKSSLQDWVPSLGNWKDRFRCISRLVGMKKSVQLFKKVMCFS